jgi:hypothetical protein
MQSDKKAIKPKIAEPVATVAATDQPVKKKRGRPPKIKPAVVETVVTVEAAPEEVIVEKPAPAPVAANKPTLAESLAVDEEVDSKIKEPKRQKTKFDFRPSEPEKDQALAAAAIADLLKRYRKDELVGAFIEAITWEELLLCLSNVCTFKAMAFDQKGKTKKDTLWRSRSHYFHDAIVFRGIPGCEAY